MLEQILKYLGYGKNKPDDRVMNLINECIEEVKEHTLWLNRPFAFVIYNTSNDTVVFAGTVYDPSK